jgi:acetolactate synthase-1/2/3 large subunit
MTVVTSQESQQRKAKGTAKFISGNSYAGKTLSGAEIFVRSLIDEGVDTIFGYPGGVVLSIYDVLYNTPELKHVLVRHEQGGTHAADGYARATGKPGVVLATSGPGATNTVTGIATAYMDSIPMVVFTGQVPTFLMGNDAFQEADTLGITQPITKHSFLATNVADLPEIIHKAFHIATTGRPGPVLVDLPKDMLLSKAPYYPAKERQIEIRGYRPVVKGNPRQIKKAAEMLAEAKRPVLYTGGGVVLGNAHEELTTLARRLQAPVTTTLQGLGAFPETDPLSLGMLGMHGTWYANMAMQEADLIFAIGARFDDRVTGRLSDFAPKAKIIHLDIDPTCIGKNVPVDLPIVGDVKVVLAELLPQVAPCDSGEWLAQIDRWKAAHPLRFQASPEVIKPQEVIKELSAVTRGEAIISVDVGQHQMWAAQYYQFTRPRSWLSSGGLGTMGFGFPAAIGAKLGCPDCTVIAVVGDGGFQMTAMEIATAVYYKIPIKIVIINNGYLGMVRQWQQLFFGNRYSHVELFSSNPDFVKFAESFGAKGFRTTTHDEMRTAFRAMMEENELPVLVDVMVAKEENCYPMVPAGAALHEMVEGDE